MNVCMNYNKDDNMKNILLICLLLISTSVFSQGWVNDNNFDTKVTGYEAFEDNSIHDVIVVEFWAEFNKDNAFKDWKKINDLNGVKYYRCNIATSPKLKSDLKIRMAPTILIYLRGDAYIKFTARAGLDLKCPVDYDKLLKAIEVVKRESQY